MSADLLAALGALADEICAALRGFDGEPGHPGEFISVNEAQGIVRETVAAHQPAEPERCETPSGRCLLRHTAVEEVHTEFDDDPSAHQSERTDTSEALPLRQIARERGITPVGTDIDAEYPAQPSEPDRGDR